MFSVVEIPKTFEKVSLYIIPLKWEILMLKVLNTNNIK